MGDVYHTSVLQQEVLDSLNVESGGLFCDVTLGDGGHAKAILDRLPSKGVVVGIDQDSQAIQRAQHRLAAYGTQFRAIPGNFRNITELLGSAGIQQVDGFLCDLGVSMLQISEPSRGFMFSQSGPLDMRMSATGQTAEEIVNTLSEEELADIIYQYGEERKSRRIARAIGRHRKERAIRTTQDLRDIVRQVVGERFLIKSLARVFQSLRIYINDELGSLQEFLPQALSLLRSGGRLAIIDYHSLEARVIKDFIYEQTHPCTCPKDLPMCVCGKQPTLKIVHRQIKPSENEILRNPSARSARLRVMEKL